MKKVELYKDGKLIGDVTVKPGQYSWDYNVDSEELIPAKLFIPKEGPPRLIMINRHLYVQGKDKKQAQRALIKLVNDATRGAVSQVNIK